MSRIVQLDSCGNDITCMKVFDALKYPCNACDIKECASRETYEETVQEVSHMNTHLRNYMYEKLKGHIGHKISCVAYGDINDPEDICIECEDCYCVLVSAADYEAN